MSVTLCELRLGRNGGWKQIGIPGQIRSEFEWKTIMDQREPNLIHSGLSQTVTKDGVTVEVSIVRLVNETSWSLEVVNSSGTSIVWDDLFPSDEDAYEEFQRTVADEGIRTFLDGRKVIPFRR